MRYDGTTGQPTDNTGALYGWVSFDDGAFVANEPEGASTWYPVNDHQTDKATYDFRITVPDGKTAVANGELVSRRTDARLDHVQVAGPRPDGAATCPPPRSATTTCGSAAARAACRSSTRSTATCRPEADDGLARTREMIAYFSDVFGRYPFTSYGAIIDDDEDAGYALETQTRPIYSGAAERVDRGARAGAPVVRQQRQPALWRDIWLNEGFATYAEWLWEEHTGGATAAEQFDALYAASATPRRSGAIGSADPGAENLFVGSVYDKGAMTLQALREKIGDRSFFALLKAWYALNRDSDASTADFIALAERVSRQELSPFFQTWLYTAGKPATW